MSDLAGGSSSSSDPKAAVSNEREPELVHESKENPESISHNETDSANATLDESTMNMCDVLKDQEDQVAEALAVLGGSDENNCTYSKARAYALYGTKSLIILYFSGIH